MRSTVFAVKARAFVVSVAAVGLLAGAGVTLADSSAHAGNSLRGNSL